MPARFIIDTAGVVRYARVDPDYTRRPEPQETLNHLRGILHHPDAIRMAATR